MDFDFSDPQFKNNVQLVVKEYLKNEAFTDRKLTDTPTDDLQVVNRKYVNMYGSVVGAPTASIIGQQFFSTDLGYPIFKHQNGKWVSATGSVVGG